MRALSLDKSNGEGTRSDEDALENQSIRGMVYIITLTLSLSLSLFSYVTFSMLYSWTPSVELSPI